MELNFHKKALLEKFKGAFFILKIVC